MPNWNLRKLIVSSAGQRSGKMISLVPLVIGHGRITGKTTPPRDDVTAATHGAAHP